VILKVSNNNDYIGYGEGFTIVGGIIRWVAGLCRGKRHRNSSSLKGHRQTMGVAFYFLDTRT